MIVDKPKGWNSQAKLAAHCEPFIDLLRPILGAGSTAALTASHHDIGAMRPLLLQQTS